MTKNEIKHLSVWEGIDLSSERKITIMYSYRGIDKCVGYNMVVNGKKTTYCTYYVYMYNDTMKDQYPITNAMKLRNFKKQFKIINK